MSGIMSPSAPQYGKIVFPAPPPTKNDLTTTERQQLVRKTKKIEQLLGTTPHFVDVGARRLSLVLSASDAPLRRRLSKKRSSIDSMRSSSSQDSTGSSTSSLCRSCSISSEESMARGRQMARSDTILDPISCDDDRVPFLRLTLNSNSNGATDMTPPLAITDSQSRHPYRPSSSSSSYDAAIATNSTADVDVDPEAETGSDDDDGLGVTAFLIPSHNKVRKQKMDRLRKKLGHDVPLALVFPGEGVGVGDGSTVASGSGGQSVNSNVIKMDKEKTTLPPLPPPPALPARGRKISSSNKLATTRDSISDVTTPHRATKRQQHGRSTRRRHVSVPPRPTCDPTASATHLSELRCLAGRLSLIVESPDEQLAIEDASRSRRTSIRASEWLITIEGSGKESPCEETGNGAAIPRKKSLSYRKPVPAFLP